MSKWSFLKTKKPQGQATKTCSKCSAFGSNNENYCVKCGSLMVSVSIPETSSIQIVAGGPDNDADNTPPSSISSRENESEPSARNRIIRRVAYGIGVLSAFTVLAATASTSFEAFVFGRPAPVTIRVPVPIDQTPIATWGLGQGVALSADGKSASPVLCSEPHYQVITSKVTSQYDCPYVSNYSGSNSPHAWWYHDKDGVHLWCAVKTNP